LIFAEHTKPMPMWSSPEHSKPQYAWGWLFVSSSVRISSGVMTSAVSLNTRSILFCRSKGVASYLHSFCLFNLKVLIESLLMKRKRG
jgi:hypothetical protein